MKKIGAIVALTFSFYASLWGQSLRLLNDSSYHLTAYIYSANGSLIGNMQLQPKAFKQWQTTSDTRQFSADSITPFTVIWKCEAQNEFSVCKNVATGSTVTAFGGTGSYTCSQLPSFVPHGSMQGPPHGLLE